ncbi:MAG TPA: alpha-2-macroglobulin family protein [Myxococcales bacterium]|jgi:hypothetical protein
MFSTRNAIPAALLGCAAVLGGLAVSQAAQPVIRPSKFFDVDVTNKKVVGPAKHVPGTLHLNLASVTVDQPQYWPNEAVHLKVMMPGRANGKFKATVQRKDANKTDLGGSLDAQGVAVLTAMDGAKDRLAVGEYRIDVKSEDSKASGHATFSVVEGTLGAVSLAYDFKQVTTIEELEKASGAWFMGNPGGAGKRWGNGLSFKNEIRLANQPFDGDVQCISRCMLPGCNGVQAGTPKTYQAVKGKIEGTMDVGGHSGPFQIEFVTPKGSLRHQFEGSSHVERDFVLASGGVTWVHRAGLAPYEKTVPVPGRQIFVEKAKGTEDPFEIDSVIAKKGELAIHVAKDIQAATMIVWTPKGDGDFEPKPAQLQGDLKAGQDLTAKIAQPYSLVTIAGYVGGEFKEGWALAFVPAGLQLDVEAPPAAAPAKTIQIGVSAKDETGAGAAVSGILEVYDNRVADRSPFSGLASELGDSIRNTSNSVSNWQDRTGIDEEAERLKREKAMREMEKADRKMLAKEDAAPSKPRPMAKSLAAPSQAPGGMARGRMGAVGGKGGAVAAGQHEEEEEKQEIIREGEKKVVFCDVVRTDASGKAVVEVTLPPQIGRVSVRFVAVKGLDHASVQKGLDVAKKASAEASMPRTFVPGAQLQVPITVSNTLPESVTLTASGAGIKGKFTQTVAPGSKEFALPWAPTDAGKVLFVLTDAKGKALDKRELPVQSVAAQKVTFSRLVVAGKEPIAIAPEETAIVYAGPGALLKGLIMNMTTTMESWFGHAEALSARAAVHAVMLSAISRKILDDEGLSQNVKTSLDKSVRDLEEAFFDGQSGLVRPYPGLPVNPLWSAWTSKNLHAAARVLKADAALKDSMAQTIARCDAMTAKIDAALAKQQFNFEELGYNAQGETVIPVEVDGKVVYRVLTDDAVTKWVAGKLLPTLDPKQENVELAFSKAYDTFRFLRAFQRVGALQYLTEAATALWLKGDRASFDPLFARIARGMILAQEPGMVQGPATLGGVYSSPMAMVRFLELLLAMGSQPAQAGMPAVKGKPVAFGEAIRGGAGVTVSAPACAVVRLDRAGTVTMAASEQSKPMGKVELTPAQIPVAGEAVLTVTLEDGRDPLEYYALIAVPSTTAIKQTEDILSDYKGQLIYGQQAMGGTKMQLLAVPFRGSKTVKLLLEGAWAGSSPGTVAIRHVENPFELGAMKLPVVTVTAK